MGSGLTTGASHVVDFYTGDGALVERVATYLSRALDEGGRAVAVCTPEHRRALAAALGRRRPTASGTQDGPPGLVLLDAAGMLDAVLTDGQPDARSFDVVIGDVLRSYAAPGRPLHVFGEMVELLWRDGRVSEAIELEQLWNDLAADVRFELYCAYDSQLADQAGGEDSIARVCAQHTAVVHAVEGRAERMEGARTPSEEGVAERQERSGDRGQGVRRRRFPPDVRSVARARRFVQQALRAVADELASDELASDVLVTASELATNAVVHSRSPFEVTIARGGDRVRLSVWDPGPDSPVLRPPGRLRSTGRGLQLVDSVASRWGVERRPVGKVVWAEFEPAGSGLPTS